jgi:hypothetical protein
MTPDCFAFESTAISNMGILVCLTHVVCRQEDRGFTALLTLPDGVLTKEPQTPPEAHKLFPTIAINSSFTSLFQNHRLITCFEHWGATYILVKPFNPIHCMLVSFEVFQNSLGGVY